MKKLPNPRWMKAIEVYVHSDIRQLTRLAEQTEIPYDTIIRWFRNKEFLEALYKRHSEVSTRDLIDIYDAMVVEAKTGNVRAADFVYKVRNKLESRNEGMMAPYTQYIQINNMGSNDEVDSAEVMQDPVLEVNNKVHDKVHLTPQQETKRIDVIKKTYKKQKVNKTKRNALLRLKRRAKKVGLASLGHGRPSKTERAKWLDKLEKLEKKQGIKHPSP